MSLGTNHRVGLQIGDGHLPQSLAISCRAAETMRPLQKHCTLLGQRTRSGKNDKAKR
jgi:hypothetical protein